MKDTASSDYFKLTYYSNCRNPDGRLIQTNECKGLRVGQEVEFQVKLTATSCPPDPKDWKQRFYIYPIGHSENLTIDVNLLCQCQCEIPGNPVRYDRSQI